jgi:Protein of unknown function (DUF1084)
MEEESSADVLVLTRAGVSFSAAVSDWWNEINESPHWQDGVFYFLSASYALVSAIALVCQIEPSIFFLSLILVPGIWILLFEPERSDCFMLPKYSPVQFICLLVLYFYDS